MTNTFRVVDYDVIYLSYDEPNAEKNYADLVSKCPWAEHVKGVKGSDSNIINADFLNQAIDFDENTDLTNKVISWTAKNIINGLSYGNGGLKCWPKQHVLNMRTHENAPDDNPHAQVDFCWDTQYIQMNGTFSTIHNNATPQQAWRAGFREGVKMALDQGVRPDYEGFKRNHWKNLHRLYIWLMIGADVENGRWAIYGAREGLYKTMCTDWDYVNVRDFEYLNNYWKEKGDLVEEDIEYYTQELGDKLINELDIPIAADPLDANQSMFFKSVYQNPARDNSKQFLDREV